MKTQKRLDGFSLGEILSELGRRRANMRETKSGGVAPSCECGDCLKCKKRKAMREYRAGKVANGTA